jgi:hypothetical protein
VQSRESTAANKEGVSQAGSLADVGLVVGVSVGWVLGGAVLVAVADGEAVAVAVAVAVGLAVAVVVGLAVAVALAVPEGDAVGVALVDVTPGAITARTARNRISADFRTRSRVVWSGLPGIPTTMLVPP